MHNYSMYTQQKHFKIKNRFKRILYKKKNKKKRDKIRSNKNISLNKAESPKETITELDVEKEHFSKKIHMRKRTISIYFKYWHSAKLCLRLEKEHANYSQSV